MESLNTVLDVEFEALETPETKEIKKENRKMSRKKPPQSRSRVMGLSIPSDADQLAISILAEISGTTISGLIRDLLEPYVEYCKIEVLKRDGFLTEYGTINQAYRYDEIISHYHKVTKSNPKVNYDQILKHKEETGLEFPFLHPENMY